MAADELLRLREDVPLGRHKLEIEETVFRFADYEAFLAEHAEEIEVFRETQQAAFHEERRRWEEAGISMNETAEEQPATEEVIIPDGCHALESPVTGSVWKIHVEAGARVISGGSVMILEAMKMEIALETDEEIEIVEILAMEGSSVRAGQPLAIAKRFSVGD